MFGLDSRLGGPPVAFIGTVRAVRHAGVENHVVFPCAASGDEASVLSKLRDLGVPTAGFALSRGFGDRARRWGISLSLLRWILMNATRFDLIHTHGAWTFSSAAALIAARLRHRPCILTTHESLTEYDIRKKRLPKRIIKRLLRRAYLRWFDVVITASELERSDSALGHANVRVIPHAVNPIEPLRSAPSGDGLRVGFLGRLDPKKQLDVLLVAMTDLPRAITLTIAGDGPSNYRDFLRARIAECGLTHRVKHLGFIDQHEKAAFFQAIDVLVVPSAYECFCVAAAEALSAGVPVVVSEHVGIAPVVAAYRCGIVVRPTDRDVTDALLRLHRNRLLLSSLASQGPIAARQEFSLEAHGTRVVQEYRRVSAEAAPVSKVTGVALE